MEKFYIAEEGSRLRKDYLDYLEIKKEIKNLIKQFFEVNGITANKYYAANSYLAIAPTDVDKEKFHNQLCKPFSNNLCKFRSNSKINKAWISILKKSNIKIEGKPIVGCYFSIVGGHIRSRLFMIDGVVYCSFDGDFDFTPEDKLTEIEASKFYKVIEDYEKSEIE